MFIKNCVFSPNWLQIPLHVEEQLICARNLSVQSLILADHFCTTNSSQMLVKERSQNIENSWKKQIILWTPCRFDPYIRGVPYYLPEGCIWRLDLSCKDYWTPCGLKLFFQGDGFICLCPYGRKVFIFICYLYRYNHNFLTSCVRPVTLGFQMRQNHACSSFNSL